MSIEEQIAELIQRYQHDTNKANLSEADVRAVYIDQLFLYLGWDGLRKDPYPNNRYYREGYLREAGS